MLHQNVQYHVQTVFSEKTAHFYHIDSDIVIKHSGVKPQHENDVLHKGDHGCSEVWSYCLSVVKCLICREERGYDINWVKCLS